MAQKVKVQCWGPVWSEKVGGWCWVSSRSGWLLELLTELIKEFKDDGKLLSKNLECFLYAMNSTLFGKECEEDNIVCTARDGYWAGREICLEKRYRCDNFLQCEDGSDEVDCEETYQSKNIFTKDHLFMCKSPFLTIKSKQNKTGKFFPMRGIWYSTVTPIVIPSWFLSTLVIFIQSSIDKSNFQFPWISWKSGATVLSSVLMVMMKRTVRFLNHWDLLYVYNPISFLYK